jgi:hypothetical protein
MRKPTLDTAFEKRGPKPKIEDAETRKRVVVSLARNGTPLKEIAKTIGCSLKWLKETHGDDIHYARQIADALVSENLYRQAMKDNPASINAAIYITKARMGWADKKDDVSRQPPQVIFNFGDMTYEERMHLMQKIKVQLGQPVDPEFLETEYEVVEEEEDDADE